MGRDARSPGESRAEADPDAAYGVLCALRQELGPLEAAVAGRAQRQGVEVLELDLEGRRVLACVGGVGKVRAAQAASVLIEAGATRGLLVVGVCGGLRQSLVPGTLIHCARTAQTDLAVREGREIDSDPALLAAWTREVPGERGWFLTADRPVLSLWRRLRLARAFLGPCVADMETAAAAAVAVRAGVPWAALRAVTDRASSLGGASFRLNFPVQAGRSAETIPALLRRLAPAAGSIVPPSDDGVE